MHSMRSCRFILPRPLTAFLLALLLVPLGAAAQDAPADQVLTVFMDDEGRILSSSIEDLPVVLDPPPAPEPAPLPEAVPEVPAEKIHPELAARLGQNDATQGRKESFVVSFRDPFQIPRLEDLDPREPLDSPANTARARRNALVIGELKRQRAAFHAEKMKEIGPRFGARLEESFWLINAIMVRMPLAAVRGLAQRSDVTYIGPRYSNVPPPIGDGNALNDVIDGREEMSTDAYFNDGLGSGFIGLLDTGVHETHVQFNNPSHLGFLRDCVNGDSSCSGGNPSDDYWDHGTQSMGILTANTNQGGDYRGVTEITVDSFKVYTECSATVSQCGLDRAAAVRGFQAALNAGDRIIVAEIQDSGGQTSDITNAADNAFDAGAAVIAANGNSGPSFSTVRSPANGHKVLGVGAVDVVTLDLESSQSRGPAPDGRIKPDIQGVTNTETASNQSNTALDTFGGTSGSTPYAAGAAALYRNWLIARGYSGSPGHVYAHMIVSGQRPAFDNTYGAGLAIMITGGVSWRSSTTVANGETKNIPLDLGTTSRGELDAAIWWPESASQAHNNIDLYLYAPDGTRYSSTSAPSVFERARATGSLSGTWYIQLYGRDVPAGPQTVYWVAHAK